MTKETMFAKLGDYLDEHNIQRPMRYVSSSGEGFVILPARDYTILTGIDADALPMVDVFDTVSDTRGGYEETAPTEDEHEETLVPYGGKESSFASEGDDYKGAFVLANLQLEEEISVENLPL